MLTQDDPTGSNIRRCCRKHEDEDCESSPSNFFRHNKLFIVCNICHDKRCPKADDCANECTARMVPVSMSENMSVKDRMAAAGWSDELASGHVKDWQSNGHRGSCGAVLDATGYVTCSWDANGKMLTGRGGDLVPLPAPQSDTANPYSIVDEKSTW